MNDTYITFHGYAGSDVRHRAAKEVSVATLRVASTPRLKREGEWVDGETTWYSVTAWRTLADHVHRSVHKGDPVIVHGRLRTESWQAQDGTTSTTLHVEATMVGHDLTRGLSHFVKTPRPERVRSAAGVDERWDPAASSDSGDAADAVGLPHPGEEPEDPGEEPADDAA